MACTCTDFYIPGVKKQFSAPVVVDVLVDGHCLQVVLSAVSWYSVTSHSLHFKFF